MKEIITSYFQYSRRQQRAIVLLVLIVVILSLIRFYLPSFQKDKTYVSSNELNRLMALIELDSVNEINLYSSKENYKPSILTPFKFNPNVLDEAGFKRLGLRDKLVATLLNYRNKGGKFYNKESLKRIYVLHEDEYKQLEPFIDIPDSYNNHFEQKPKEIISIELNSSDTTQLIKLRGIGSKLAMNIIRYREQLGGFARVEQMKEVYGISEETFVKIKGSLHINLSLIKKLNLNAATLYELNAHPYLRGDLARALVDYRKLHNYKIDNLNQINEIPLINDEIFRKIVPYLQVE